MVDVISTRFQGMYGSWNYFNNNTNNSSGNMPGKEKRQDREDRLYREEIQVGNKTTSFIKMNELFMRRFYLLQTREESLYKLKNSTENLSPPDAPLNSQSLSCRTCSPGQSVSA